MARILSVWSPTWPIAVWRRKHAGGREAGEGPFALVLAEAGVRRLYAVDEAAAALGLYPGQKATDAAALCPGLVLADADPEGDRAALLALADWCVRVSPAVAPDPPDGLLIDIAGLAHLWGGEDALVADLLDRLAANGLPARAAVADTAGAAWALAQFGGDRIIAPPGGQAALLATLPVAALRLEPVAAAQLPRLGLRRIGQLAGLPRDQVTRRFGPGPLLRLDQALGRAEETLAFRRPPSPWFDRLAFAEPISVLPDLVRAAGDIATRLCARLEAEGMGARRFEIAFHRLDGQTGRARIGLSLAGRDPARITRLIVPRLEAIDPGFGVEVVTLIAEGVEPLAPRQGRLDADAAAAPQDGLAPLVDRLVNRLGGERVWRSDPVESHVPERAVRRAPPLAPAGSAAGWDPERPRPVRLFRQPEPVTVMARLPDDPPLQFRWRGRVHRVARAEGPERIAEEWWRRPFEEAGPGRLRDYYRVEDVDGGRFWLFRAGLYGAADAPPRWWLHGLFG